MTASSKSRNRNVTRDFEGRLMALGRNMAIVIEDEKGRERAFTPVPYGSRIHVDEGDKVKQAQRLAEWDPYTRPVLTEVEGSVEFEEVIDGLSVTENR